uniref:Uncharacterized protein n=1 Tax=Knipowitschia caucasica TaxID=637954 RepID=A0AAV2JNJ4_KNICA
MFVCWFLGLVYVVCLGCMGFVCLFGWLGWVLYVCLLCLGVVVCLFVCCVCMLVCWLFGVFVCLFVWILFGVFVLFFGGCVVFVMCGWCGWVGLGVGRCWGWGGGGLLVWGGGCVEGGWVGGVVGVGDLGEGDVIFEGRRVNWLGCVIESGEFRGVEREMDIGVVWVGWGFGGGNLGGLGGDEGDWGGDGGCCDFFGGRELEYGMVVGMDWVVCGWGDSVIER